MISPWIEGGVIVTAGQTVTGSFRGFHVLNDATFTAIEVTNVRNSSGALITTLPALDAGVPFYGNITSITVASGTILLW